MPLSNRFNNDGVFNILCYEEGVMQLSRFSEEQIIRLLKRAEGGGKIVDLCCEVDINDMTFQHWKATFGGLEVNEARRPDR